VDGRLIEGLLEHEPALDLVRVQDVGLQSADDRVVLARAADEGRIVITDDRSTLSGFAYERVAAGQSMPGVIVLNKTMSPGDTIEQLLMIAVRSSAEELEGKARFTIRARRQIVCHRPVRTDRSARLAKGVNYRTVPPDVRTSRAG
jgi:predicted nuclease of predicted toxin-antitoxin system